MNLFEKRNYIKPYEYPEMMDFVDSINSSYWTHKEYNFISDINDFKELEDKNKNDQIVIKNCLLAISQIEVSVKNFWGDIYKILPKPEVASVGSTFAESEVRHERAYSSLLEILGLNGDFKNLIKIPAIKGRVEYLEKYNNFQRKEFSERKNFLIKLTLFTLLIENVSLFTQFLIIKSYNKHLNILKGIDNVIQATQLEENIHAMFGSYLINTILEENKDWFNDDFKEIIIQACKKSYEYEKDLLIWITNKNTSSVIDFNVLDNFLKRRINQSLGMINIEPAFQENEILNERVKWFEEEILTDTHTDFFNKQSVSYNKYNKNFSLEALF